MVEDSFDQVIADKIRADQIKKGSFAKRDTHLISNTFREGDRSPDSFVKVGLK